MQQPWEHQRRILHEDLGMSNVVVALQELPVMLDQVAANIERSSARKSRTRT